MALAMPGVVENNDSLEIADSCPRRAADPFDGVCPMPLAQPRHRLSRQRRIRTRSPPPREAGRSWLRPKCCFGARRPPPSTSLRPARRRAATRRLVGESAPVHVHLQPAQCSDSQSARRPRRGAFRTKAAFRGLEIEEPARAGYLLHEGDRPASHSTSVRGANAFAPAPRDQSASFAAGCEEFRGAVLRRRLTCGLRRGRRSGPLGRHQRRQRPARCASVLPVGRDGTPPASFCFALEDLAEPRLHAPASARRFRRRRCRPDHGRLMRGVEHGPSFWRRRCCRLSEVRGGVAPCRLPRTKSCGLRVKARVARGPSVVPEHGKRARPMAVHDPPSPGIEGPASWEPPGRACAARDPDQVSAGDDPVSSGSTRPIRRRGRKHVGPGMGPPPPVNAAAGPRRSLRGFVEIARHNRCGEPATRAASM